VDGADVVVPLLFQSADESNSPYFAQNLAADAAAAQVRTVRSTEWLLRSVMT
jgi:hypothetical protein